MSREIIDAGKKRVRAFTIIHSRNFIVMDDSIEVNQGKTVDIYPVFKNKVDASCYKKAVFGRMKEVKVVSVNLYYI